MWVSTDDQNQDFQELLIHVRGNLPAQKIEPLIRMLESLQEEARANRPDQDSNSAIQFNSPYVQDLVESTYKAGFLTAKRFRALCLAQDVGTNAADRAWSKVIDSIDRSHSAMIGTNIVGKVISSFEGYRGCQNIGVEVQSIIDAFENGSLEQLSDGITKKPFDATSGGKVFISLAEQFSKLARGAEPATLSVNGGSAAKVLRFEI